MKKYNERGKMIHRIIFGFIFLLVGFSLVFDNIFIESNPGEYWTLPLFVIGIVIASIGLFILVPKRIKKQIF